MLLDELDDRNASVELDELDNVALLVLLLDELDDELTVDELDELLDSVELLELLLLDVSDSSPPMQTRTFAIWPAERFVIVMTSDAPPVIG